MSRVNRRLGAAVRLRGLVVAAFLVLVTAGGCGKSGEGRPDLQIHTSMAPQPVHVGASAITVDIADRQQRPETGAQIQVEGDMAHPGMAPVFSDATETAPGTYTARLNFNMPGDWVVLLHIRLADGRKVERQIDVRGVAGR